VTCRGDPKTALGRRAVLTGLTAILLGGSGARTRRIGFISSSTTDPLSPLLTALRDGLALLRYEEGRNLEVLYRLAKSREELPAMAADLVSRKVEVIIAAGSEAILAARDATGQIPIVMTNSGDAVREGFVASLGRPSGNITGMTQTSPETAGKRLEILLELVPSMRQVGILWNPVHPNTPFTFAQGSAAAVQLGLQPISIESRQAEDVRRGVVLAAAQGVQAFLVIRDPFTVRHRALIVDTLRDAKGLAVFETAEFLEAGGLIAYGADFADLFRRSATYVHKLLEGARPESLPVEQPTRFELLINLRTARTLGIDIPASLLAQADEVIE
jgi:putative tryptophan/tyrosine transport system substrate-binding protein